MHSAHTHTLEGKKWDTTMRMNRKLFHFFVVLTRLWQSLERSWQQLCSFAHISHTVVLSTHTQTHYNFVRVWERHTRKGLAKNMAIVWNFKLWPCSPHFDTRVFCVMPNETNFPQAERENGREPQSKSWLRTLTHVKSVIKFNGKALRILSLPSLSQAHK